MIYTYDTHRRANRHRALLKDLDEAGIRFKDLHTTQSSLEDIFVSLVKETMNVHAIRAIYAFEMARTGRTLMQSIISPVISTSLYFVVFGAAIGSRIPEVGGISYGAFIVPGLIMLSLLTQSISNASFGIYFPKFTGHDLRAPVGAGFLSRDRAELRRGGRDQVDRPRPDHPGDRRRCSCRCGSSIRCG